MEPDQARDIVALLRAATRGQVDEGKARYFEAALLHLEYPAALAAANMGTVTWRLFPSWAEFKEIYRTQTSSREADEARENHRRVSEDEFKRGVAAPEWVWVWSWCRGWGERPRRPPVERPFPQQAQYTDMREAMTMNEYEVLLAEWVEAGSPKGKSPLPMMR